MFVDGQLSVADGDGTHGCGTLQAVSVLSPPADGDAGAILHALALRDEADTGDPTFSRAELTDRWLAATFLPARDSVVAWRDGAVAGYAAAFGEGGFVFVTPGSEGRGIGTALLHFAERRARELGQTRYRQRVAADNLAAAAFLSAAGYRQVRTVWQMVHSLHGLDPPPAPPDGVRLRAIDRFGDAEALHAADTRAFAGMADYTPESLEDFIAEHLATGRLDREASQIAERDGAIAGYLIADIRGGDVGHIDLLAVAPGERRRGVGSALLLHALAAFATARRSAATLEVASDNPAALRLYEGVGMTPRLGAAIWEKPV
jgi:mycothiol synthase